MIIDTHAHVDVEAYDEDREAVKDYEFVAASDHPTDPSSEIATNACASIANSIGRACKTSLQNPFTTNATASSSPIPRWRQ